MGRYITIRDSIVVGVRTGSSIVEGEIENNVATIGDIQQANGTFIRPDPVPVTPSLSVDERLTGIEDTQDLILLKLEGII